MKLFTGWVISAGLVFTATAANAQVGAIRDGAALTAVSDIAGPYRRCRRRPAIRLWSRASIRRRSGSYVGGPMVPRSCLGHAAAGATLRPACCRRREVYAGARERVFAARQRRGSAAFYTMIAVIDRAASDGRLVIDARNGRIVRFMPAYRMGDNFSETPRR